MKIPKRIRCGGLIWKVSEKDLSDVNKYGQTNYARQEIEIDGSITDRLKEQTFLHELLHVAAWDAGLDRHVESWDAIEESVVNSLANRLYEILKENRIIE